MNRRFFLKNAGIVAATAAVTLNIPKTNAKAKSRTIEEIQEYVANVMAGRISQKDFFNEVMAMSDAEFLIHIKYMANIPNPRYGSEFLLELDNNFERKIFYRLHALKKELSAVFVAIAAFTFPEPKIKAEEKIVWDRHPGDDKLFLDELGERNENKGEAIVAIVKNNLQYLNKMKGA